MPASASPVVCRSSFVPGPGSACTGTGAAAKLRGGDAGTPHEGSGSAPPSIPGGAPSRCTGSLGTIEAPGRDHGAAAGPPPGSGVPGPLRFLRTGSSTPVGGSDGPPTGPRRGPADDEASVVSPCAGRTIGIGPLIGAAGSAAGPGVCTECRGT